MTIDLPQELEERARARVAAGEYPSVAAVLQAALEALDTVEADSADDEVWLTSARQAFEEGRAALRRGEYVQGSPQEIMTRARVRLGLAIKST